jgi:hypothetical protein
MDGDDTSLMGSGRPEDRYRVKVETLVFHPPSGTANTSIAFSRHLANAALGGRFAALASTAAYGGAFPEFGFVHSTSWRPDSFDGVILTFAGLSPAATCASPDGLIPSTGLTPGLAGGDHQHFADIPVANSGREGVCAPDDLTLPTVALHALRHLAFLAHRDAELNELLTGREEMRLWRPVFGL